MKTTNLLSAGSLRGSCRLVKVTPVVRVTRGGDNHLAPGLHLYGASMRTAHGNNLRYAVVENPLGCGQ